MSPIRHSQPILLRFALGILLIVLVSLLIFNLMMSPPASELRLMALFLGITALASGLAGYAAYRLGWWSRSPTLRASLLAGYILSSLLTFFNVWFSARLMFLNSHDLTLAIVLLVFASGMALALGYYVSTALTDRIRHLMEAAGRLAEGQLGTRVRVQGRDELAALAASFNTMASRLQKAEQQRLDLIAWVGHDLQTPLASVRAILEALQDGVVTDPATVDRYLSTAQRDVQSLSALIDDLFLMAQMDAGGLQLEIAPASLADLISDTLESFSELARARGVLLEGNAGPEVDPVRMDTRRIGQALNNLIVNALRHTPAGGRISVTAGRTGAAVQVSIKDTGEGIRAEDLPYIFDRFFRGEPSRSRETGGAGLGLAIARSLIEAHGGQIRATSTPGDGSLFVFSIPA